jgi:RND family efflux transporter MFP subunit
MTLRRKLLVLPPIVLGVAVFVFLVLVRDKPQRRPLEEEARVVRVVEATTRAIVPRAVGHGTARPATTWRAVAEVRGRVSSIHAGLAQGAILPLGAELLRIDDTDYRLTIARLEAEERSIDAQIEKLAAGEKNDHLSLELERRSLVLVERDLARLKALAQKGATTEAEVDRQQRLVLQQTAVILGLENSLRLAPSTRAALQTEKEARQATLKGAHRDLDRCVVKAPFACRVSSVDVELAQVVQPGQTMVEVDGIQAMEVLVHLPFARLAPVLRSVGAIDFAAGMRDGTIWVGFGIEATVRLRTGFGHAEWSGHLARVSEVVDRRTRTIGLIIEVEKPYEGVHPGVRPPLLKGMFVEVEVRGKPLPARLVVPREALRGSRVHVVDEESRLVSREVEIEFAQFDEACIASGLAPGDRIVLTDLTPAVIGMLLDPRSDAERLAE